MEYNLTDLFLENHPKQRHLGIYHTGETGLHHEYHVSLHPRAKLDGIGETEGQGWVREGSWTANFSLTCLALNLDFVPPEDQQAQMLSFCSFIVYPRALLEPTALFFGIPGNIVAIKTCLSMTPLRPAGIFLALLSFGDLLALISTILPMEGSYFLQSKGDINQYWFEAFEAVAWAFPHYALTALNIERAMAAWRPVLANRLITVHRAKIISLGLLASSLLLMPMVALQLSSWFVRTSVWTLEILVFGNVLPSGFILILNAVMVFGLLVKSPEDLDESVASQISLIMSAPPITDKRDAISSPRIVYTSRQESNCTLATGVGWFLRQHLNRSSPKPPPPSFTGETDFNQNVSEEDDEKRTQTDQNVLAVLRPDRNIFNVWADEEEGDDEHITQLSQILVGESATSLSQLESLDPVVRRDVENGADANDEDQRCLSLREHSSLTRMSLLASASFFLMEWPLTFVTLIYQIARGADNVQSVKNPLTMVRLLYLYELFAWISSMEKGIKLYMYLLGAPRFRKHFVFTMMRQTKGGSRHSDKLPKPQLKSPSAPSATYHGMLSQSETLTTHFGTLSSQSENPSPAPGMLSPQGKTKSLQRISVPAKASEILQESVSKLQQLQSHPTPTDLLSPNRVVSASTSRRSFALSVNEIIRTSQSGNLAEPKGSQRPSHELTSIRETHPL